jgi:hypothetical protein
MLHEKGAGLQATAALKESAAVAKGSHSHGVSVKAYPTPMIGVQDHFDFDFVEVHKVTEFRLECRDTASCWNIDGELLTTPNIHVKVWHAP